MTILAIIRLILTLVSVACGIGGLVNATQAGSNLMAGGELSAGDGTAVIGTILGSIISALAAWFAPNFLPNGVSSKESTEAAVAIVAWVSDPKNPKKIRTAGLECLDVMFELIDPADTELQNLLRQVSAKFHEKYGRLPLANGPVAAEPIIVSGRKSR